MKKTRMNQIVINMKMKTTDTKLIVRKKNFPICNQNIKGIVKLQLNDTF